MGLFGLSALRALAEDTGLEVTDATFDQAIASGVTVVDFNATWCGPCRALHPVIAQLHAEGLPVVSLDIDNAPNTRSKYGVRTIPQLVVFKDGVEVFRPSQGGFGAASIKDWIRRYSGTTAVAPPKTKPRPAVSATPATQPVYAPPKPVPQPINSSWGQPPDNSGSWSQVYLDGKPAWRNTSTGQISKVGATPTIAAAPPPAPKPVQPAPIPVTYTPPVSTPTPKPAAPAKTPKIPPQVNKAVAVMINEIAPIANSTQLPAIDPSWSYEESSKTHDDDQKRVIVATAINNATKIIVLLYKNQAALKAAASLLPDNGDGDANRLYSDFMGMSDSANGVIKGSNYAAAADIIAWAKYRKDQAQQGKNLAAIGANISTAVKFVARNAIALTSWVDTWKQDYVDAKKKATPAGIIASAIPKPKPAPKPKPTPPVSSPSDTGTYFACAAGSAVPWVSVFAGEDGPTKCLQQNGIDFTSVPAPFSPGDYSSGTTWGGSNVPSPTFTPVSVYQGSGSPISPTQPAGPPPPQYGPPAPPPGTYRCPDGSVMALGMPCKVAAPPPRQPITIVNPTPTAPPSVCTTRDWVEDAYGQGHFVTTIVPCAGSGGGSAPGTPVYQPPPNNVVATPGSPDNNGSDYSLDGLRGFGETLTLTELALYGSAAVLLWFALGKKGAR